MSDNVAVLEGFTREAEASNGAIDLYLLIRPGTDLESTFRAWDTDEQEFIVVNGWLFTFEFPSPSNDLCNDQSDRWDGEPETDFRLTF